MGLEKRQGYQRPDLCHRWEIRSSPRQSGTGFDAGTFDFDWFSMHPIHTSGGFTILGPLTRFIQARLLMGLSLLNLQPALRVPPPSPKNLSFLGIGRRPLTARPYHVALASLTVLATLVRRALA